MRKYFPGDASTYLVRPLSQDPEGQEDETKHHAQRDNAPLDIVVLKQVCHASRTSSAVIDSREGSGVKDDVKPNPSGDPSMKEHESIHAQTSDDGQGRSLACHENEQRQLCSAKDRGPVGKMSTDLIALACRARIECVLVSSV